MTRRAFTMLAMVLMTLALLQAPAAEAGKRRCRSDRQCKDGTCNTAGQCCNTFSGEVACGSTCCNTLVGGDKCCGNSCIDTQSDSNNCGGCGIACTGGHTCANGACVCPEGTVECGGECVDTTFDNFHCGACNHPCGEGQECVDSTCQSNCPAGYIACGGQCLAIPRGTSGQCCQSQSGWHACEESEQCAGSGCCDAGTEVCTGANGSAQCCYGGLVCQSGRCCNPTPGCIGTACCDNG